MGNVIAFCETEGSKLKSAALANIACAKQLQSHHGGDLVILLIGNNVQDAAADAAKYGNKVVTVNDAALENYLAETYAPVIVKIAGENNASAITVTANAVGKDVLPRVAQTISAGMASDISEVKGKDEFKRPILAGNAFSTVKVNSEVVCVSARQSAFDPATESGSSGEVVAGEAGPIDALGASFVRLEGVKSDRPDLNDADTVISGGRGLGKNKNNSDATPQENFELLGDLADVLGAGMGASRAVTDAGWVPADWQIGQTGKIVAPKLYFAFAISGAIQHLAGMKGAKTIVAVNKDAEAPIFQVADYGLVTTWEEALPELIEEIKKAKS